MGEGRPSLMIVAGIAMLLLGAFALLLPLIDVPGAAVVGWLLLLGGLIELAAALARPAQGRNAGMLAGAVTTFAGLLFVANPLIGLYRLSWVVMGWLLIRGVILLRAGLKSHGRLRFWATFGGIGDILLGLIVLIGIPVAALAHSLFGATPELVASFAVVLAISFLVTGLALLALAFARRPSVI